MKQTGIPFFQRCSYLTTLQVPQARARQTRLRYNGTLIITVKRPPAERIDARKHIAEKAMLSALQSYVDHVNRSFIDKARCVAVRTQCVTLADLAELTAHAIQHGRRS